MMMAKVREVEYWNGYARWYRLWRQHTYYHKPIERILLSLISKGIRVLDIGAGDGVLSFPLLEKDCQVTALEPSSSMRKFLFEEARRIDFQIRIDPRRFEDLDVSELKEYELVLACNSLHLTEGGIESALCKIFNSGMENVFFVTEKNFSLNRISMLHADYRLTFHHSYLSESSFAYHSTEEAFEHWQFKMGRNLFSWERERLLSLLSYEKEHYWLRDYVYVNIFYFRRRY